MTMGRRSRNRSFDVYVFVLHCHFDGIPAFLRLIVLEHLKNREGYFICFIRENQEKMAAIVCVG